MNFNIMQLMQMMKGGSNPQKMIMDMLQQQTGSNPMAKNVLDMVKKGDTNGIEQFAKNICQEKGISYDEAISQFKNQLGIK
jgi:hypothetical protein